ncbi:uncharacterized protein LOC108414970 isoform X2 [Pygocentrus nattereri]|uniref:uncharacterized protein LOC108414970 isoform X2 n=1 Tax=Pygocentrus nattereri TaxID=42514 RepID=UPI0008144C04|nr:uncharacterized protein LOC108414970 isoform X2 [Pygocentrus nattereri]
MNLTSCLLMASLGLFLVLILVLSASTTDSFPKTQKKLNESAALICDQPCSGLTQWRRNGAEVAQCGPGAKQGFELTCAGNEGRSTLTVPQVTYSTRGRYSVYCSGREVVFCRQFLQLLTPEFPRELDTGDLLKMDLQISGTARILFTRTGNLSRLQLCSVDGRHHGCLPEYQKRVFIVGNTFILGNTVPSDSGIYTIQEEDGTSVSIWNVTIKDVRRIQTCQEGFGKVAGIFGTVMLVIGVFLGVFGVPRVLRLKDRVLQRLRGGDPSGSVENGNVPLKEDLQSNMNPKR